MMKRELICLSLHSCKKQFGWQRGHGQNYMEKYTENINTGSATDISLLLETVVLEGTLMLSSGSEVYRVEETMRRTMAHFGFDPTDMLVLTTGIFVTFDDRQSPPVTMIKRIHSRGLNISRICDVNAVSRAVCDNKMSLSEACDRLKRISEEKEYSAPMHALGIICVSAFFAPMFGGGMAELAGAFLAGAASSLVEYLADRININSFCVNVLCACAIALTALIFSSNILPGAEANIIIMGAIMPLVPGSTFLTSIRDMLNGDYSSGTARMMEAAVTALAVAVGVGFGMLVYGLCR